MDIKKKTKEWSTYIVFIVGGVIAICITWGIYDWITGKHIGSLYFSTIVENDCNIAKIPLQGELVTYISDEGSSNKKDQVASEDIVAKIEKANKNKAIKAILLQVDSFGGSPVGGEEIQVALEHSSKPTFAFIREGGTSAAYRATLGAKKIFASEISLVGGIGVTMSYVGNADKNNQEGLVYNQLSLGKFKDAGDPDKPLTVEEKEMFMKKLKILQESFIVTVAKKRNMSIEAVTKLADGSSYLGITAKENGLIDVIGNIYDVQEAIGKDLGIDPIICENE